MTTILSAFIVFVFTASSFFSVPHSLHVRKYIVSESWLCTIRHISLHSIRPCTSSCMHVSHSRHVMMDTSNGASKKAAVKLIPKKLAVRGRWRKQPSNESFGSLVSTENEEHPGIPETERGESGPGSLSTTQSNESAVDGDDSVDFDIARDSEHES